MKYRLFFPLVSIFFLSACAQMAQMAEQERLKRCTESAAYEKGYNDGNAGLTMNSSQFSDCNSADVEKFRTAYQNGFKETARTKPTLISPRRRRPHLNHGESCSTLRVGANTNCFMDYEGERRGLCEVCIEKKSCFMALSDSTQRGLCEAYRENKSCMMALPSGRDREWCEHLKENKSCIMAFSDRNARRECDQNRIPQEHIFWSR